MLETGILFYGGAFNPIHNGHLVTAKLVAEKLGKKQIALIPCANPPHKNDLLDLRSRIQLCKLAIEHDTTAPTFRVMDAESLIQTQKVLEGKSSRVYTFDTVDLLNGLGWDVTWLIGGDTVHQLPTWHRIEELAKMVRFVAANRPGYSIERNALPEYLRSIEIIDIPQLNISSSDIRQRVREKKSIHFFCPPAVANAIRDKGYYGEATSIESLSTAPLKY